MTPGPKPKYLDYLAIRIEPDLKETVEKIAQGEERTPSQMVRILIREAVAARESKKRKKK